MVSALSCRCALKSFKDIGCLIPLFSFKLWEVCIPVLGTCNIICHMGNFTLSVMPGTRSRTRKYVNSVGSQISSCQHKTFEKQPCRNLPKCETKSYAGGYDPFFSQVKNPISWQSYSKKRIIVFFDYILISFGFG